VFASGVDLLMVGFGCALQSQVHFFAASAVKIVLTGLFWPSNQNMEETIQHLNGTSSSRRVFGKMVSGALNVTTPLLQPTVVVTYVKVSRVE
jgi:hypothetical protein